MHVNFFQKLIQQGRIKLFLVMVVLASAVLLLMAFMPGAQEISLKRMNIAMRSIGHELLQRSGDFTSVVPPVIERSPGVFVIEFENEFAFRPDTLVAIVQRIIHRTTKSDYAVTVHPCNRPFVVYGFENSLSGSSAVPCRGRNLPKACYEVEIAFADLPGDNFPFGPTALIFTSLSFTLGLLLSGNNLYLRKFTKVLPAREITVHPDGKPMASVGKFAFDTSNQLLRWKDEVIPLTDKECKILKLLQEHNGQLTSRDLLIQQVWTVEGVITGRSLDMFISKLRKKLSRDEGIRITSIHGKGYRLDVAAEDAFK